jgi:hypothetical protein
MMRITLLVSLLLAVPASAADGVLHQWQGTQEHVQGQTLKAMAGGLDGTIVGLVRFSAEEPKALILPGDVKSKHRIDVTTDIKKANLPAEKITVEAWVWIDRVQEWGAIAGAFQHNGPYQKGWLLGYQQNWFFFALNIAVQTSLALIPARPKE